MAHRKPVPAVRAAETDWRLWQECLRYLCGGNPMELSRQLAIHPNTARWLLKGNYTAGPSAMPPWRQVFYRACGAMHVDPMAFRTDWREEFDRRVTAKRKWLERQQLMAA